MARLPHTVFCVMRGALLPHFTGRERGGRDWPCWKASAGVSWGSQLGQQAVVARRCAGSACRSPVWPWLHDPGCQRCLDAACLGVLAACPSLNWGVQVLGIMGITLKIQPASLDGTDALQGWMGSVAFCPRCCHFPLGSSFPCPTCIPLALRELCGT